MAIPLSFWEYEHYSQVFDLVIVGAGFVGLSAAIEFKKLNPKSSILILEKGDLGQGASTKNAGFSCFGSIGELEDDLHETGIEQVVDTIKMRWDGLQLLRSVVPDTEMDYVQTGGWEVFEDGNSYSSAAANMDKWNSKLESIIGSQVFSGRSVDKLNFFQMAIYNPYEGQLNPMKAVQFLIREATSLGIVIVRGIEVVEWRKDEDKFDIIVGINHVFKGRRLLLATNGFTSSFLPQLDVRPARNQVMMTSEIEGLSVSGNFHYKKGYIYFRNVGNRLLIGGARFVSDEEYTDKYGHTELIESYLTTLLKDRILIESDFEIDFQWSGILGVGRSKGPIIQQIEPGLHVAVRLGGMGVAIGMGVGQRCARDISLIG